jgi:excinuclease ABC subunit A
MCKNFHPLKKLKQVKNIKRRRKFKKIDIPESVNNVIVIDQDPIGRTPRSNPATYTKIFDDIRINEIEQSAPYKIKL